MRLIWKNRKEQMWLIWYIAKTLEFNRQLKWLGSKNKWNVIKYGSIELKIDRFVKSEKNSEINNLHHVCIISLHRAFARNLDFGMMINKYVFQQSCTNNDSAEQCFRNSWSKSNNEVIWAITREEKDVLCRKWSHSSGYN